MRERADDERERARAAKEKVAGLVRGVPAVSGIGITRLRGRYAVKVSLSEPAVLDLPTTIDGVAVVREVVGRIRKR